MSTATEYLSPNNLVLSNSAITSEEDEIRRVEIQWGEAFERRDVASLDRLMVDEYILTDPLGTCETRRRAWRPLQPMKFTLKAPRAITSRSGFMATQQS
jgi:hypothetical protein